MISGRASESFSCSGGYDPQIRVVLASSLRRDLYPREKHSSCVPDQTDRKQIGNNS